MTFIRKRTAFARTAMASFVEADRHTLPGASDLDFYLFNREARMDEAWEPKRALNPISPHIVLLTSEIAHGAKATVIE